MFKCVYNMNLDFVDKIEISLRTHVLYYYYYYYCYYYYYFKCHKYHDVQNKIISYFLWTKYLTDYDQVKIKYFYFKL